MVSFTPKGLHIKAGGRASRTPGNGHTPNTPTPKGLHKSAALALCNPCRVDGRALPFPRVRSATLGFVVQPLRGKEARTRFCNRFAVKKHARY
jgi:hypothetical protein